MTLDVPISITWFWYANSMLDNLLGEIGRVNLDLSHALPYINDKWTTALQRIMKNIRTSCKVMLEMNNNLHVVHLLRSTLYDNGLPHYTQRFVTNNFCLKNKLMQLLLFEVIACATLTPCTVLYGCLLFNKLWELQDIFLKGKSSPSWWHNMTSRWHCRSFQHWFYEVTRHIKTNEQSKK